MRASILVSALLSAATVSALPTANVFARTDYCEKSPADGRGATLFKQPNLVGDRIATDYAAIPVTRDSCFNLSSLFGAWYGAAKSLVVNEGYTCDFYTEFQCTGTPLCLTGDGAQNIQLTLPEGFSSAIKSVQCRAL
ncbi:hypothetical protein P280DRAFT_40459 [Massarina eburnea CBS 473.64]|uniref:Uncharacterized protein n=1 Tax=Massarina eburnea CBS 473.64 TaxID=1395130 RepID=A0A6A6RXR2_9PLEO|nr:hypothetical protein P280DRAFT_40459 [Massarina eburnea CBS 473.64]